MEDIVQYIVEVCIKKFDNAQESFFKEPQNFADFEKATQTITNDIGKKFIQLSLERMDQCFRNNPFRVDKWYIEKKDKKQLITTMGTVTYEKTLFTSKTERTEDGKEVMCYLLDKALGFSENQRLSEGAAERIYEEAVQTSYRKGGEVISADDKVTKQAVKNLIHGTVFPSQLRVPEQKKTVKYLYIDADEDHYSLQFQNRKGDLEKDERGYKKNGAMTKLIYVYEGVEPESPKSKRYRLINAHYFCRGNGDNSALWDEVYSYINTYYDISKIKHIYLNSDGGSWIKAGCRRIAGIQYVLDEFHLSKYIMRMTGHMADSQQDAWAKLYKTIQAGTKAEFQHEAENLEAYTDNEKTKEKIQHAADYILKNWGAAKRRLWKREGVVACNAEGHVYHVLSSRMSTLAMGWSRHGASQMARLREYYYNGGSMLELVKYQKTVMPMAAGAEELALSANDILKMEVDRRSKTDRETGKYADIINHTLSLQSRKKASFNIHKYL